MPDIIDQIYEATVVPDGWIRIIDRLTEIGGGQGTLMFSAKEKSSQYICSPAIAEFIREWASDWTERNERGDRLIPIDEPRFLQDLDAFTAEELETIPIYRDLFYKWGLGWCIGTAIRPPDTSTIVFSIERRRADGPASAGTAAALDALRPHLARAAVLSAKVGLQRAWSSVMALEAVGLPAAVLTGAGKVLAANPLFEALTPEITIGARDRLLFASRGAQALFAGSLAAEGHLGQSAPALSFPLPARGGSAPAVAHLLPLRGGGRDIFTGASFLLYVTVLARHAALPVSLLEALFDLTPAEARVARLIGNGASVTEAARRLAVQGNTVRVQLKSIFAKTGARRQADLVGIVSAPKLPLDGHGITRLGNEPASLTGVDEDPDA